MIKKTKLLTLVLCAAMLLPIETTTNAQSLGDILNAVNNTFNRATAARDAARDARDNAADARDHASDLRDQMLNGAVVLSGQVQTLVNETIMDAGMYFDAYVEGRDAFVADGGCSVATCEPFRIELVALLQSFETTFNSMLAIAQMDGLTVNFQKEIDLIQNAPGRALFPLYVVITERDVLEASLVQKLSDLNAALAILAALLPEPPALITPTTILAAELNGCSAILTNTLTGQIDSGGPEQSRTAGDVVKFTAFGFKILSKSLMGMGEVGSTEIDVGVHGYVHLTLKNDWIKSLGGTLDGLADVLLKIPPIISTRTNHCVDVYIKSQILDAVDAINCRQIDIERVEPPYDAVAPVNPFPH